MYETTFQVMMDTLIPKSVEIINLDIYYEDDDYQQYKKVPYRLFQRFTTASTYFG